jgi:hypothetical protein
MRVGGSVSKRADLLPKTRTRAADGSGCREGSRDTPADAAQLQHSQMVGILALQSTHQELKLGKAA